MKDEQVRSALETWFEETDPQPPDPRQTVVRVMSRVLQTRQRGRWLPFGLFRRKTQSPTATDTTEYQPSPIPAMNGHIPTVIGRTHSMLSPAKAITAGALVFALLGAFLVARPFDQQGSVPGAATDDPAPDLGIFAPVAGRIVYGDDQGIWGVDPARPADAATAVLLTSEPGVPLGWSSDGTQLLVMRGRSGEGQLYVLHADGSESKVTERPMTIRGATISPDGSRVVLAGWADESAEEAGSCCSRGFRLYVVEAVGGPAEQLVESRYGILDELTFSPDGTQIAYVDGRGDWGHSVWLVDIDGTDAHQILANETTDGAGHPYGLAWSPAGDRIALGLEGTTYTFATDGSGFTRAITHGDRPYWSPDGSRIAYTISCLQESNGCGLAIADADGSNVREMRFGTSGPWHPRQGEPPKRP